MRRKLYIHFSLIIINTCASDTDFSIYSTLINNNQKFGHYSFWTLFFFILQLFLHVYPIL
ncbi:hypothetical protein RhiirA5_33147 [Rhizophagus irregularis]|uniref:Uncharacterized protein n=2 Tax=Rhizophagus irregularis TaxID=588596 RepID=A0A2N0Q5Z1_9GLOM|nr:hypothetical protein GLOIN_2v1719753 [Rhizophagus irregularis DAOM 181602=DAOM 197198]PKC14492.1 hypothetical protein RhiirA5_33147 [Rhizophagus irregularis]POG59729.1 hypothetical protein GLOIN_2v1719753 [Rhizophagus irregularis DAOM 181602=DAOM 197198]|eukprot:XP_025166595.1 hypothetical protein GLOIN_2v1719753 [Rhizophagus irregularis DAOM 181602=DAOM 197198]